MIALLPHCGFLSETTRMLAIARALRARGEPVCIATHGGPYARVLTDAGEAYTLLSPTMDDARCRRYLADLVQIGRPGVRLQPRDEVRAAVQAEADFLRACGARMAVIGFTLTAYLSSRLVGIPLAASHGGSYVPPLFERGLAPVPTTMPIPGTNWLPRWLKHRMVNSGAQRMRGPTRFLNEVAAELGVEPVPTLAALMLADLTLVTDVPEVLGIPRAELEAWRPPAGSRAYRPGTRLACVGPLFARLDLPVPPAVQRFLDGSAPTAYVVLSSSTPEQLRAVVRSVRAAGPGERQVLLRERLVGQRAPWALTSAVHLERRAPEGRVDRLVVVLVDDRRHDRLELVELQPPCRGHLESVSGVPPLRRADHAGDAGDDPGLDGLADPLDLALRGG